MPKLCSFDSFSVETFPVSLRVSCERTEMTMSGINGFWRIAMMALVLGAASGAGAEEAAVWRVSKSSGDVWMNTTGAQQVSLKQEDALKPGDTIRTGRNGRV